MKKNLFVLPALLLAVFFTGCSKTPDDILKSKVPESADSLLLLDGNALSKTPLCLENKKDIAEFLKEGKLPENVLECRLLVFSSFKEQWVAALFQSEKGQAKLIFESVLTEIKEEKNIHASVKDLKESTVNGRRQITWFTDNGQKVLMTPLDDNLMLISVGKADPDFFRAKKTNPLFRQIKTKETILSAVSKVNLPSDGALKEQADGVFQMFPALRKLESISLNIPFSQKITVYLSGVFSDEVAAGEILGSINMGIGSVAKQNPEFDKMLTRKVEKNTLQISFPLDGLVDQVKKASEDAKRRGKHIQSISNLKQIGVALTIYASDNSEKFPDDLNALVKGKYLTDFKCFVSPLDQVRKLSADGTVGPSNTSYAYVGKGLSKLAASEIPAAFEKPDLIKNNRCAVLYADGHVSTVKVNGRTCTEIAKELTANLKNADKEIAIVLANAAQADLEK